jgi:thiamine biosynthesis protein ThiI
MRHGIVLHYHEIGLKGRNRSFFERALVRNVRDAIGMRPSIMHGRLFVPTAEPPDEAVLTRLGDVFGVANFAPCVVVEPDLSLMSEAALGLLGSLEFSSFAIAARRASKELPLRSHEINVALGSAVQAATGARVDLGSPDVTVRVEVVGGRCLVYTDRRRGPGGLPVGVSGRVVSLLSGGIDSAVSTYRILRRGARAILVHFHSYPFTDRAAARKAEELGAVIAKWQGDTKLYLVPFGETQRSIVSSCPPALRVLIYRRFMVRIAGEVARREGALSLVTGDSLGQVASQTLENMACVEDAAALPLLRPLVGEDKQDIVEDAKRIGTYEISIQPYPDCCSLFVPGSPATKASRAECAEAEAGLDAAALVQAAMAGAELVRISKPAVPASAQALETKGA